MIGVDVSRQAEKLRQAMTRAEWVEIDYVVAGHKHTLHLDLGRQEAQKSHGLCRGKKPDVANLPAGEVYFVPNGAEGEFPMKYKDGTIGIMKVSGGRIRSATFFSGQASTVEAHNAKLSEGVVEISWSVGKLLDAHYDEFVFTSFLSRDLEAGKTLYFPVVQECEKGVHRWIELPAAGKSGEHLDEPAPGVKLLAR